MKRAPRWFGFAFAASAFLGAEAHALSWSGLWSTPDQRAERLLHAGDAAAAAGLFQDPRRKAFAEIQAQQYAQAARRLAPFADPESQYNRGNALARGGHLRTAIAAYDAALKRAPPHSDLYRDARHNRDLVEKQRQSTKPPAGAKGGSKSGKPSPGQQQASTGKPGQGPGQGQGRSQGQSQGQGQSQSQGHSQSQAQQAPSKEGPQGAASAQPAPVQAAQSTGQPASSAGQQASSAGQPTPPGHAALPAQVPSQPPAAARGDAARNTAAARAKQDAAAALAPRQFAGGRQSPPPRPESERAMSLDQWLRWIPDDPGGLLRRKFMIEHMLQQRESQQ